MKRLRNFVIIAHIDHGKSTLADRMLQHTGTISHRDFQDQMLDSMDLERERGITIKSHAIQMDYTHTDGKEYCLNLIDTPGHVDFSYEVSRSIAAAEGALLVVDATQGIQAQTIANLYMAIEHDLEIIPVLNKMDLEAAQPEEVKDQIVDLLGCDREEIIQASAKTGLGTQELFDAIIERIPQPEGDPDKPLKAMIFDSVYNAYRGVIVYFRIFDGTIKPGEKLKFVKSKQTYDAEETGVLQLKQIPRKQMSAGEVGYLISGIKTSKDVKVGDTVTHVENPCQDNVSGFEDSKPMVFAGVYPIDTDDYEDLRASLEKLQLNDASLSYEPESSMALGFGFRCGFLGMLHMEIVQERLDREFDMGVITTVPNVSYNVYTKDGQVKEVHNPSGLPDVTEIDRIEEPIIHAQVITRENSVGGIMKLCMDKRGVLKNQVYLTTDRVELTFDLPLSEVVFDFYDRLKSISRGYASLDYYTKGYQPARLIRLDILINGEQVDALSTLTHFDNAYGIGRRMCQRLKELIPRQQFDIAIQAGIGNKIIARETVKALRKDVTAKCYGGDITRKRKLLEKQKKGKKRMRQVGNVEIPQKAFMHVLKMD